MKFTTHKENAKGYLIAIYNRLGECDVRGNSVEHMFISRGMLKEFIESMKEDEVDSSKEEQCPS